MHIAIKILVRSVYLNSEAEELGAVMRSFGLVRWIPLFCVVAVVGLFLCSGAIFLFFLSSELIYTRTCSPPSLPLCVYFCAFGCFAVVRKSTG